MTEHVTRQDFVEMSLRHYLKQGMVGRGYGPGIVELTQAFPNYGPGGELSKVVVAQGFDQDQEAREAELGSSLVTRPYNFEFVVFAPSRGQGLTVANQIKFILDVDTLPLYDWTQPEGEFFREIDQLVGAGTIAQRQIVPDPEPWQENVWLVVAVFEDTYDARLAA